MCEVNQKNENNDLENRTEQKWMDEKTMKIFFWVMISILVILALRPTFTIVGSGNGNGNGNNVFKPSE